MYTKEMLITDPERNGKRVKAVVRNYIAADFEELIRIQAESFLLLIRKSCSGVTSSSPVMCSITRRVPSVLKSMENWLAQ